MPFVISTFNSAAYQATRNHTARRAVATLEEARNELAGICPWPSRPDSAADWTATGDFADQVRDLTDQGGSIGPLPDGTVIEVTRVCDTWCILVAEDAGHKFDDPENVTVQEGIDAYNAAQS